MQNPSFLPNEDYLRALHIGEVAFSYYQIQRSAPTEQDYKNWISMLPLGISKHYQTVSFEDGKDALDFRRYFLQIRFEEMKTYMEENLSAADFTLWQEMRDTPENL